MLEVNGFLDHFVYFLAILRGLSLAGQANFVFFAALLNPLLQVPLLDLFLHLLYVRRHSPCPILTLLVESNEVVNICLRPVCFLLEPHTIEDSLNLATLKSDCSVAHRKQFHEPGAVMAR